jgi:hypothetical protein
LIHCLIVFAPSKSAKVIFPRDRGGISYKE